MLPDFENRGALLVYFHLHSFKEQDERLEGKEALLLFGLICLFPIVRI